MSVQSSHELKGLQTSKERIEAEIRNAQRDVRIYTDKLTQLQRQLEQITTQIQALSKDTEPVVSEHALLRWLERKRGIDLEQVKQEVLQGRVDTIKQLGTCRLHTPDGLTLIVKQGVVVTIND